MVCCRYLRFQMGFDVDVLGFQIEICCRYFDLFCLGDCLGYFLKNWAKLFSNLLVTLLATPKAVFNFQLLLKKSVSVCLTTKSDLQNQNKKSQNYNLAYDCIELDET
jgi:hypothetical protein